MPAAAAPDQLQIIVTQMLDGLWTWSVDRWEDTNPSWRGSDREHRPGIPDWVLWRANTSGIGYTTARESFEHAIAACGSRISRKETER